MGSYCKKKSKELSAGANLAGDVTQEFELEQKIMQESGWGQFLSNCVSKWIELETKNAKQAFKKYQWPVIDVTRKSIEETAASIIKIYEIKNQNA